ncbi:hypothetical protein PAAG_06832 [Paracoccidioides lutzii Pb01]|uniref:O-methyltransferase C-terminal domain-containing protein n=1 Tax=Paracoccidioides lutzii (strain ATCC MYA-826 / Pb01) TaxID=502779 RepID=C1H7U1_PARBA|nr:hypothetical protein PAAG_06832 [Paracoccidioides lutzii Pb01]EEH36414.2 hypothetical protein PAAG_06832 [Paracoccidioides lutzii Pb01]
MQPIKNATVSYLHRIFHDWPEAICVEFLGDIASSITDKTRRVVIADDIVPEKVADTEDAWMDLTIMTLNDKAYREAIEDPAE